MSLPWDDNVFILHPDCGGKTAAAAPDALKAVARIMTDIKSPICGTAITYIAARGKYDLISRTVSNHVEPLREAMTDVLIVTMA